MPFFYGLASEVARRNFGQLVDDMLHAPGALGVVDLQLQCVSKYKHMGRMTLPCGSVLPEIAARHGSTRPYVDRLSFQFFKKTKVPVEEAYCCFQPYSQQGTLWLQFFYGAYRGGKAEIAF